MDSENTFSKKIQFYNKLKNISLFLIVYTVLSYFLSFLILLSDTSMCLIDTHLIDYKNSCLDIPSHDQKQFSPIPKATIYYHDDYACENLYTIQNENETVKIKSVLRDLQFSIADGEVQLFGKAFPEDAKYRRTNYFTFNPWLKRTVFAHNGGAYSICDEEIDEETTLITASSHHDELAFGKGLILLSMSIITWGFAKFKLYRINKKMVKIPQTDQNRIDELLDRKTYNLVQIFRGIRIGAVSLMLFIFATFVVTFSSFVISEACCGCPLHADYIPQRQCLQSEDYQWENADIPIPLAVFYFTESEEWNHGGGCAHYPMETEIFQLQTKISKINVELQNGKLFLNSKPFPVGSIYQKENYFYWNPWAIEIVRFRNMGLTPICEREDEGELLLIDGINFRDINFTKGITLFIGSLALWLFARYQTKAIPKKYLSKELIKRIK